MSAHAFSCELYSPCKTITCRTAVPYILHHSSSRVRDSQFSKILQIVNVGFLIPPPPRFSIQSLPSYIHCTYPSHLEIIPRTSYPAEQLQQYQSDLGFVLSTAKRTLGMKTLDPTTDLPENCSVSVKQTLLKEPWPPSTQSLLGSATPLYIRDFHLPNVISQSTRTENVHPLLFRSHGRFVLPTPLRRCLSGQNFAAQWEIHCLFSEK